MRVHNEYGQIMCVGRGCRKTLKYMNVKIKLGQFENIKVRPERIHLGTNITSDGYMDSEVTNRSHKHKQTAMHNLNNVEIQRTRDEQQNPGVQHNGAHCANVCPRGPRPNLHTAGPGDPHTSLHRQRTQCQPTDSQNYTFRYRNLESHRCERHCFFPTQHRRYKFIVWTVGIRQPTNAHPIYVRATERFGS